MYFRRPTPFHLWQHSSDADITEEMERTFIRLPQKELDLHWSNPVSSAKPLNRFLQPPQCEHEAL